MMFLLPGNVRNIQEILLLLLGARLCVFILADVDVLIK